MNATHYTVIDDVITDALLSISNTDLHICLAVEQQYGPSHRKVVQIVDVYNNITTAINKILSAICSCLCNNYKCIYPSSAHL